jgi:ribosomal protein S18 acetylase RimI-like enzyme
LRFFRSAQHRVQLAGPDDAAELAGLYLRAWSECPVDLDPRLVADNQASIEEVRAWLGGGFEIFRATDDERAVGVIRCSFPASTCHLDRLAVDPQWRRRGFGLALVEHSVARARRAGVTRVWVQTNPKLEDAPALFKRVGFREAGRLRAEYWGGEPLVLLELPL